MIGVGVVKVTENPIYLLWKKLHSDIQRLLQYNQ